jgi:hypothetical protein
MSFGLLNNQPPFFSILHQLGPCHIYFILEADYLASQQFKFYSVRLLASRPTPNLEDQVSLFVWLLPLDLSGMADPTSSYATAGIALRISGALKPHHMIRWRHHRWGLEPLRLNKNASLKLNIMT